MTTSASPKTVTFIGLGVMGFPMAGHLSRVGFNVNVFNRTPVKSDRWLAQYTGAAFVTPSEAVKDAEVVCLCVGNDDDVRSVMNGTDGILESLKPGAIVIDHTTTSAELAEELQAACHAVGAAFMDAPVSGGQAGAENGCLTAMCGASPEVYEAVADVLAAYCANTQLIGPVGQGQRCKMINQICIAGVLEGLSEGLQLATAASLPIDKVVAALKGGAAGSWQLANRFETMNKNEFDFGFAIDWMIKDLGICLDESAKRGVTLPMIEDVTSRYKALSASGKGRCDTSALVLSKITEPQEA